MASESPKTGMALIDGIADAAEPGVVFGKDRGCNRIAFSSNENAAFQFAKQWANDLFDSEGLVLGTDYDIAEDNVGNLFITLFGEIRNETVMSGSHLDSVPDGGKFDGAAGVASALDFLQTAVRRRNEMRCNYTVAVFRSEESSMTGLACLGSAIATGALSKEELNAIEYKNGATAHRILKLREYYSEKYGELLWSMIEGQLEPGQRTIENGFLNLERKMKIRLYEELHIEQSAALELTGSDVGVVTDIGGAMREEVKFPTVAMETVVDAGNYRRIAVRFTGQAAHSGGTPPNETADIEDDAIRYRRDALLGSAWCTRTFFERWKASGHDEKAVKILRCAPPKRMGYTTVPPHQNLEIAVRADMLADAQAVLETVMSELSQRKGISAVSQETNRKDMEPFSALDTMQSLAALALVETVDHIVREADATPHGHGRVRYTVTDFVMDPANKKNPLQWKLDLRHTAAAEGVKMQREFHRQLAKTVGQFGLALKDVLVQTGAADTAQLDITIAETKMLIADLLGFKAKLMPSMPGHDARNMALAGIRTGMTFVRHDGISHNPEESMDEEWFAKAKRISHGSIAEALGFMLDSAA